MPHTLDQILPSLEALGLWSYWIIGLASMLEAFFATGVFVPGTLVVDSGGILVQQGAIDFFDLAWFVAIGSILGGEISYWAGVWARRGMNTRWKPENSPSYLKAERLFRRHGGLALVLGRFAGPVSGLVPFAAAVAGMERRKFLIWNIFSGFPYALGHVAFGYFLGDVITRIGPIATRLAIFAGAVLLLLAVLWWLIIRIERMLPFVLSILRSIAQAVATNPDVAAWSARHPKLAGLIAHRFDASRASGLTATLLGGAILYILVIWAGSALDFLMAEPIVLADTRLANLIHAFWTPWLLKTAAHVTALGDWRVVASLMVAALAGLWLRRRPDLMLGLTASVAGNVVTVALLKRIFDRPRPELAYFVETSGSFPSGHAAISVALYGMLFFAVWRLGRLGPIMAALLAATLAFVIGLSRLYLIEHYLTDVLNGWLVGTLWLLIGIALGEWWRETRGSAASPDPGAMRAGGIGLAVVLVLFAGWQIATYDKARNVVVAQAAEETVADIADLFASGKAPNTTESIIRTPLEPVNAILLARDEAALTAAMTRTGWKQAEKPTLGTLARAGWALVTGLEDDTAPVTPYFWRGQPNDIAFQKPTPDKTIRKRHHVRFWRSNFVTPGGLRLFIGAASFDDGLDWLLLHHIDPNVDAERDTLVTDLRNAGVVAPLEMLQLSKARLGISVAGDPWFTDGKTAVVTLK
ncbi:LssY C-terminal domain-containing protein [Pseudophaeobacter sp. 1A09344]|uniref:LssY C-terminal domain-containing protein n=1 Tax=Pseudophaeobacter sp. 1A09344 TaxID=3098144 RepID=UPI0034D6EDF9